MFYGVIMYVLHMRCKIIIIPDLMLPEPSLPDRLLALAEPRSRTQTPVIIMAQSAETAFNQSLQ